MHRENNFYNKPKERAILKTRILIHAKLPIFINPRKCIHAKISTFTVITKIYVGSLWENCFELIFQENTPKDCPLAVAMEILVICVRGGEGCT